MPHPSVRRDVECTNCGHEFDKPRSEVKGQDNHFCDRKCFNAWHTGENNHQFSKAKVDISCDNCGKNFERYRSKLSEQNFCSKGCYSESMEKENYKYRFYNTSRWENKRNKIIERDGGSCKWCGSDTDLHIHDLRPVSEGGDKFNESNLVTLCQQCHVVAHHGLKV